MTRAQMRREEKKKKRQQARYSVTKEQLDELIEKELKNMSADMRQDMINNAMILTLSLPLLVLKKHYWKKSFEAKAPAFCDKVLDLYDDWADGKIDIDDLRKELEQDGGLRFVKVE